MGIFVFCKANDCPNSSDKTLAVIKQPVYVPSTAIVNPVGSTYKVYFALGKSGLSKTATQNLQTWLPDLKKAQVIHLRGWADSIGGKQTAINKKLSLARAKAVQNWLKKQGVQARTSLSSQPACCNRENSRMVAIELKE